MDSSVGDFEEEPAEKLPAQGKERLRLTGIWWDRSGVARLHRSDGKVADFQVPWPDEGSYLDRMVLDLSSPQMFFHTTFGDWVCAELPAADELAPLNGRPVVYLDQKDWSTLFKALRDPARVQNPVEKEAAHRLMELADARRIVLPLSHGHFSETAKFTNARSRYNLSLTMLRLSAGWQMRDPLEVRRQELTAAIARELGSAPTAAGPAAVFTLEPWAISSKPESYPNGLPPEVQGLFQAVLHMTVYFSLAFDPDSTPMGPVDGWVKKQQNHTDRLHEEDRPRERRRKIALAFALEDASREMAEAAAATEATSAEFENWLKRVWFTDLANLPAFAFFRELFVGKHLNATTRWEENDLTDMWYLATAAAYADYVVAERRTISLLGEAAQRLNVEKQLHRNLSNLVEQLERDPRVQGDARGRTRM